MRMHNPAHPGLELHEYLGQTSVTEAALRLGVTRAALSRILNGKVAISADMLCVFPFCLEPAVGYGLGCSLTMIYGKQSRPSTILLSRSLKQ